MEIKLNYQKHGIDKCNNKAVSALFYTIGYLGVIAESEQDSTSDKEFSKKILETIKEQLKDVLIEEEEK